MDTHELAILEDQLAMCEMILTAYQRNEGQSREADANFRHKQAQAEQLRARIAQLKHEQANE